MPRMHERGEQDQLGGLSVALTFDIGRKLESKCEKEEIKGNARVRVRAREKLKVGARVRNKLMMEVKGE